MELYNLDVPVGATRILRFQLIVPQNVSTWTTQFTLTDDRTGAVVDQLAGAVSGIPNAATLGILDVLLSAAVTLAWTPRAYHYTFWRTDPGSEDLLVHGTLNAVRP
jgi:hypothetical protein